MTPMTQMCFSNEHHHCRSSRRVLVSLALIVGVTCAGAAGQVLAIVLNG
jgi:hypothetical protein